jgi:conjugal transfer mating pair stabilization protein TraG
MFGRAETLANSASTSFSAANTQAADFRRTLSAGTGQDTAFGAADSQAINQTWSQIDSASKLLQERLGFDRQTAEKVATQYMFSGNLNTGISWPGQTGAGGAAGGAPGLPITGKAGVGVNTSGSKSVGTDMSVGASSAVAQAQDLLASVSRSQGWTSTREGFFRATANSTSSNIRARSESLSSSYTEANAVASEARQAFETARRYEEASTLRDSEGVSISDNLSQRFVNFVLSEQARTPWLAHDWNPTRGMPTTRDEIMERDMYLDKFLEAEKARIAAGVTDDKGPPTAAGLIGPSANSQSRIASFGAMGRASITSTPVPRPDTLRSPGEVYRGRGDVAGEVAEKGEERLGSYLEGRKQAFEAVDKNLTDVPQQTMDNVVGKDDRNVGETFVDGLKDITGIGKPKK